MIPIIFGSLDFQLGNLNRWRIFRGWKYAYINRLNTKIRVTMLCLVVLNYILVGCPCLLYRKSCEVWAKNPVHRTWNVLTGIRRVFDLWLRTVVVYQKVLTTGRAIFSVVHSECSLHIFAVWAWMFKNWSF